MNVPPVSRRPVEVLVATDGTGDYATLQAALAAFSGGGVSIALKRGTYNLPANFHLPGGVWLRGEGNATIIRAPLGLGNAVSVTGPDAGMEKLVLDGRYSAQTNNGGEDNQCGICLMSGADRFTLRDVQIKDTCGMGLTNILGPCNDLLIDGCRFTNGGNGLSTVQALPAPSTTVLHLFPGCASFFSVGQSVDVGPGGGPFQVRTISAILQKASRVAAAASASVFTVDLATGPQFAPGDVLRIGANVGTVQSIAGDVLTLTAPLATIPTVGDCVGVDRLTLSVALSGVPAAGTLVVTRGGFLKGIYCRGGALRTRIVNSYFEGWSQAVGWWYGGKDGLIEGCAFVRNFGYEDATHVTARSCLELYPAESLGGDNRIIGNIFDGGSHNCIECAQGELGTEFLGNIFRNWADEVGLPLGTGVALQVQGEPSIPGEDWDIRVIGNRFFSKGGALSTAFATAGSERRVLFAQNQITGFSVLGGNWPVAVAGEAIAVLNNQFGGCATGIYSAGDKSGRISGNSFTNLPPTRGSLVTLPASPPAWLISDNDVEGEPGAGGIVFALTGNGHRILRNRIVSYHSMHLTGCADCLIADNDLESNADDGLGGIWVENGLRNIIVRNRFNPHGNYAVGLSGSSDYNCVQENMLGAAGEGLACRDFASGTHNRIEPNHEGGFLKTVSLKSLGSKTVGASQATIAHGLGYAPTVVQVLMTSAGQVWKSAASDATNLYLTADGAGRTCEVAVR